MSPLGSIIDPVSPRHPTTRTPDPVNQSALSAFIWSVADRIPETPFSHVKGFSPADRDIFEHIQLDAQVDLTPFAAAREARAPGEGAAERSPAPEGVNR